MLAPDRTRLPAPVFVREPVSNWVIPPAKLASPADWSNTISPVNSRSLFRSTAFAKLMVVALLANMSPVPTADLFVNTSLPPYRYVPPEWVLVPDSVTVPGPNSASTPPPVIVPAISAS